MGFSLGDILAGGVQGFGTALAQQGQMQMKQEQEMTAEQARQQMLLNREKALAQFKNDLNQPQQDFENKLKTRQQDQLESYQKGLLDDKAVQRTLTDDRNKAVAERDMARAEAAAAKAGAGTGKREQDLSQRELEMVKSFNERIRDAEKDSTRGPAEAQRIKLEMIDHFGDRSFKFNTDKDGNPTSIVLKDRLGNSMTFPNYDAALKAGAVDDKMRAVYEKITQAKKPNADESKKADGAASSGEGVIEAAARAKAALGGNLRPEEQAMIDKADAAKAAKQKALTDAQQAEWKKKQQNFGRQPMSLSDLVKNNTLYSQNYGTP